MNYQEILYQLRNRYNQGDMSALVGAGFSKNISDNYMSWDQLLYDMVNELYENEIDLSYREYLHINSVTHTNEEESRYRKTKISEIIARDGYLNIVDKFIQSRGFREAVEVYIEERTPYITSDGVIIINDAEIEIIEKKNLLLHEKLLKGMWDNLLTTNYDNALEYVAKSTIEREVIAHSARLSFSKHLKPIIKIHGSITHNGKFEFDGKTNKRYVISKADYDNYPEEHEAFTQFMRITLLRGCFCLFGFSGNDPNFISWIKWVRDILLRNNCTSAEIGNEESNHFKVFLLSINDSEPSKELKLFYLNHKIAYIPLQSPGVKAILEIDPDENNPKTLYSAFFDFLYRKEGDEKQASYHDIWEKVLGNLRHIRNSREKGSSFATLLSEVERARVKGRFHKYIWRQDYFLKEINAPTFEHINKEIIKLALIALEDTKYIPSSFENIYKNLTEILTSSEEFTKEKDLLEYLEVREGTLSISKSPLHNSDSDEYIYERAIYLAFSFKFSELKGVLDNWEPTIPWLSRKAMLVALFDREQANLLLTQYVDRIDRLDEKYMGIQLLNIIDRSFPNKFPTTDFESQNIDSIHDALNSFKENIIYDIQRVQGYGALPQESNGYSFSKFSASLRFLQYLIDTGLPITYVNRSIVNGDLWYQYFKYLYEYYPYPCLYYSTQLFHQDNVVKRIGQDFAYNDKLQPDLKSMLTTLLNGYYDESTPEDVRRNILLLSGQFLVSVSSTLWQEHLIKIWDRVKANFAKIEWPAGEYEFVSEGLQYLPPRLANLILKDCLEYAKVNRNNALNFICDLHLREGRKIDDELTTVIDKYIAEITTPDDITIIGCVFAYLTNVQKENVRKQIANVYNSNASEDWKRNAINITAQFAKSSKKTEDILKSLIIRSPLLFYNGVNKYNVFNAPNDYIRFTHIEKNIKLKIKWRNEEVFAIYTVLKERFNRLKNSTIFDQGKPNGFGPIRLDYVPLLKEMLYFLKKHKITLHAEKDYDSYFSEVSSRLHIEYRFNSIEEALTSTDQYTIKYGIDMLIENIEQEGIAAYKNTLLLLTDRLLLKKTEAFLYAISALYHIIKDKDWGDIKFLDSKLILILGLYKGNVCVDLNINVPQVYSYLVKIAILLKKQNASEDENVTYWLEVKKTKRYNTLLEV